ncbi:hypothetical protein TNCV_4645701 [Trichonephila clavipes]|nr:hypothetical protein TNCV_4645701 [Trichonephila clavipes]
MHHRKGLSPDEITNLLREIFVNESDGGTLSCFNLDSDEDIKLNERNCEESEESADILGWGKRNPLFLHEIQDFILHVLDCPICVKFASFS